VVAGAPRKPQSSDGIFQQLLAVRGYGAKLANHARRHLRIRIDRRPALILWVYDTHHGLARTGIRVVQ
jgi:hypothetical protein